MKNDSNIIDEVLRELDFSDNEKNGFKDVLKIITENKKYGLHKDLRSEIKRIIERDDLNAN